MLGMAVGNIAVTALTTPLVKFFGNGDEHQGYVLTTVVFVVFSALMFLVVFKNCKERYVEQVNVAASKEKGQLIATYKNAFKNGPWVSTLIFSLLMFIKIGGVVAITIYFCIHVLNNSGMISVLLPLLYVSMLISAAIAPAFLKKFKHRKGNMIALVIYVIGVAFMPLFKDNMTIFVALWFVANMFGGINSGAVFGMTADSVDYNEWKFNKRSEGTLYAGYSFATKVGMAIGGAAIGYVLAFSGYNATEITPEAVSSINVLYFAVPIVCSLLQIIALSFYKLDAIHPQIVRELEQRRTTV
jgi:GPH family glycoside/pentoside/hexuronide:cation symporter